MLFSFTGERIAEKTTAREVSQGGTISISGTSGDPSLAFASNQKYKYLYLVKQKLQGPEIILELDPYLHSLEEQNLQLQNHQQILHCSLFKENLRTSLLQTMLVLVHSENYLVLQSSYLQSRREANSLLVCWFKRFRKENFQRNPKVNCYSIWNCFYPCFFGTSRKGTAPISTQVLQEPEILLVLDLFQHSVVLQNLLPSIQKEANALLFCRNKRFRKITARELGTPGEFTLQGTSGDPLLTFAEKSFGNVTVSGVSTVIRTQAFAGSGRLFGFANGDEAYARAPYVTSVRSM